MTHGRIWGNFQKVQNWTAGAYSLLYHSQSLSWGDYSSLFILRLLYLPRIFRKKRKIRHSLSSLFDLGASESWLHESIFESDSSPREETWLEGIRSLETYHCNQNGESKSSLPWWTIISKWIVATLGPRTNVNPKMTVIMTERMDHNLKLHIHFSPYHLFSRNANVSMSCKKF